jgi:hypothetical protein
VYAGIINRQMVFCCHPIVVMGRHGVAASFSSQEEAFRFLVTRGFSVGTVFRHSGSNWDKLEIDPARIYEIYGRELGTQEE